MKRGALLAVALVATLAASAWLAGSQEPDEALQLAPAARRAAETPAAHAREARLVAWPAVPAQRDDAPWPFDARQARAWLPPAVAVAATPVSRAGAGSTSVVAPLPQAPAFPYTLIGRIEDGSVVHALLGGPQRTLGVRELDVIDGQWRVDAIGGAGLTLTWLPGGLRQTIAFRPS